MASKITYYLLLILIFSLGFGQLLKFEIFGLPIFLHDILILILIPILLINSNRSINIPTWLKLIIVGLIIGAVRALAIFPISSLSISLLYSLRLITYLIFYLTLRQSSLTIHPLFFILSGFISLTIGLAQYLFMPDMRLFQYLGWDDHLFRLTLPHFDPTFSASMLAIYLLYLAHFSLFIVVFLVIAILLTYSRSIWLSLVLTLILFIKNKRFVLSLVLIFSLTIFLFLPKKFGEGTNLKRTFSIQARFTHDLTLANQIKANFITGIGYNNLPLLFTKQDSNLKIPNHARSFNNSFLTILATSGIIGLWGWILWFKQLFTHTSSQLKLTLSFVLIGSLFNNLLLYPSILVLLIILLSIKAPTLN